MSQYSSPTIARSHAPSRTAFAENRYRNCQSRDHCKKQKDMKTKRTTKIQQKNGTKLIKRTKYSQQLSTISQQYKKLLCKKVHKEANKKKGT